MPLRRKRYRMDIGATVTPATNDSKADDEVALQDFYTAMDGDNWDNNTGWSADSIDLDQSMFGVFTKQVNGETRVDVLNLSGGNTQLNDDDIIGNNLTGDSVPDSFGNLKQMTGLRLKGNNITAPISNWVQSLTSIVVLSLSASTAQGGQAEKDLDDRSFYPHPAKNNNSYNKWTGEIPDDLSMLTNLELIEVANSDLTGTLPTQLPDSIRGVFFINNKLGGTLPAWANCTSMTHLFLGNRYDGGGDGYTGELPAEWDNMDIVWFSLETGAYFNSGSGSVEPLNNLTGGIPEYRSWTDLRYFETTINESLGGDFPNWIVDTPGKNDLIHTLDVGNSGIGGSIENNGGEETRLGVLGFADNNITGAIPAWVFDTDVIQINLRDNQFSGQLPDIPSDNIRWIQAENNEFTGTLPDLPNASESGNFTHIRFQNNNFSGDIPASYGTITANNFDSINLSNNLLDGTIPLSLFGNGWSIDLDNNKYTPKNLVPILGENLTGVDYLPQKNFGEAASHSVGDTIDFSSYNETDNTYQWYKDDVALSGETSNTIDTTSHGVGTYHMEIENTNIDYTFTSTDQTVT